MSYTRYIQIDRAWRLRRRRDIPYYSAKKDAWCFNDEIDISLERLIQKFVNYQLKFRYRYNDEITTRSTFTEVLKDMTVHYNDLDIADFEDDYNPLQREWLLTLQKKLRAGEKLPLHTDDIIDACETVALCNEIYEFLVKPNQTPEDCWHVHNFDNLLSYLLDTPEHFSVTTFEDEYSRQQLELIQAVKDKLLSLTYEKDLFKKVRIKSSQRTGIFVDISIHEGRLFYLVEADERNSEGIFPIYDCLRKDLVFE